MRSCSPLAAYGAQAGGVCLFLGGPVDPQAGFVLHSTNYRNGTRWSVGHRRPVALTSGPQILRDIGLGKGAVGEAGGNRLFRLG
ncbi:MAG: hypothetical protein FWC84_08225, partial [Alphaproteobacteria bacterium]|nr:hypothetical protein [Alphaproteobacteria bacterium]